MSKSLRIRLLSLLLILPIFLAGCGQSDDNQTEPVIKKKVQVQEITKQNQVTSKLTVSGTVTPKEYSLIRSLTPGTIEYLAPVGSEVKAGQPLFSIQDSSVENNYFTTLQNFQTTSMTTSQQVQQAELGLNSAKARLDLARSQYDNTVAQTQQNMKTTEDSAKVTYDSAYNVLKQLMFFLGGNLEDQDNIHETLYVYSDILAPNSQLKINTIDQFPGVAKKYLDLESEPGENLEYSLQSLYNVLYDAKGLADNTVLLLQNAEPSYAFNATRLATDKSIMTGYQAQVNQYTSALISSLNALNNTTINNQLAINNFQNQLDLAEIQYNNADVALSNAKDGAELQNNAAQAQLNQASYNYNNLSMPSPFTGTILSHMVTEGEQVSVGTELIEIGNLSLVEIKVDVDIDFAKAIKLGDEVKIDNKYSGIVTEIEPIGDLKSGKVGVTVQSQQAGNGLTAGSIADVEFTLSYNDIDAIVIPIKSANIEASGNYVYVVEDGKIARKNVTLGQVYGDKVSVINGLNEGDKLVISNGVFVATGDEVEIVQ